MTRLKFENATCIFSPINFSCSTLFNLKPYAGTNEQKYFSTSRQKSRRFFGCQAHSTANTTRLTALKRRKNKKGIQNATKVFRFWKWESSLVRYKCGYSGPGMLGEFVVVLLMWCLGAPSILISMLFILKSVYEYFKKIFENVNICLNTKLCF